MAAAAATAAGCSPSDYAAYLEVALAAAKEAGAVIAEAWNKTKTIDTKSGVFDTFLSSLAIHCGSYLCPLSLTQPALLSCSP
jgi:hypothetical protein